ncbi:MAG: hypothetical protein J6J55_01815, partial [Paludibacteraceae bacterium]|nr:hypothetical protein [Paludibacteraceae bacterium]
TLDIAKIEDITPEPEVIDDTDEEPVSPVEDDEEPASTTSSSEPNNVVDVPFTITNEVPEDSKPIDEQLSLF